jgi:hypothetical protein
MKKTLPVVLLVLAVFVFMLTVQASAAGKPDKKKHPPSGNYVPPPPSTVANYIVTVVTGDVEGAGTNANVYITLHGETGNSPETQLRDANVDTFEHNAWNDFTIDGNFGSITSIRLRHDNSQKKPGWFVTLVRVKNKITGTEDIFLLDRWLAKDENDKRIDITVPRSNARTVVLTAPYSEAYKWTKSPGVSSAWARAYKANGWFNFYADAFIGGAIAEAGHIATFYANGNNPVAIKARLIYVGGPINFGIASFSELQSSINFNGSVNKSNFKAAFTGSIIKDKIKKVIALTDDSPDFSAPFNEFVDKMNEGKSYTKLAKSFETLKNSKEAKELILYKTGKTRGGNNSVCASIRTNAGAVLTGSSVIIVGGIVESFEVIGVPK